MRQKSCAKIHILTFYLLWLQFEYLCIMNLYRFLSFILLSIAVNTADIRAQVNVKDSVLKFTMVHVTASLNTHQADLRDRFGFFSGIGISALRKTKSSLLWGASAEFLFGGQVKERNMLDSITVEDGFLVSTDGTLSDLRFNMRGLSASVGIGKIFNRWGHNVNSGPFLFLKAGYLEHKINFETDRGTTVPSHEGDYNKGYDRLTGGILSGASLGYQYFSNNTLVNFFVKVDYQVAFTKNLRKWNFDSLVPDTKQRTDSWMSISFGWTLPIYRKAATDYFYF